MTTSAVGLTKKATGWAIGVSILLILLGIMAIALPFVAGLAVSAIVGWMLVFGGVTHLAAAFHVRGAGAVLWEILVGLVYLVGGGYTALDWSGDFDAVPGWSVSGRRRIRNRGVLRDSRTEEFGMDAVRRIGHDCPGRVDLVPLAIELSLGDRNDCGDQPADERSEVADDLSGVAECDPDGGARWREAVGVGGIGFHRKGR